MRENASLSGCIGQFDLEFVEREATPKFLMKLGIQLHLSGLSLSNTVSIIEVFGVERSRSTVHNWVHKADLQPEEGRQPTQVAVDETVVQINDEQYWLYAAVETESNEFLHTRLETTTNSGLAQRFLAELRDKHDLDDATILIDGSNSLNAACSRLGLTYHVPRHGDRNSVERVFREVKRRTVAFSNYFSHVQPGTADDWLTTFAFAWNRLI